MRDWEYGNGDENFNCSDGRGRINRRQCWAGCFAGVHVCHDDLHWRTYERLRAQADAADAEADALLVESMPGLKELLADSGVADPAPPRPKRQRRRRDGGQ
jgi:hypothetical protein